MAAPVPRVPWEYLSDASIPSLESFELSRLNHAANVRKEIAQLIEEWLEESAAAMVARWLLEHRYAVRNALARRQGPPPLDDDPDAGLPAELLPPALAPRRRRCRAVG